MKTPFDLKQTLAQLDAGTCNIRGQAFVEDKHGRHYALNGSLVILAPRTPYLDEFLALSEEHGKGRVAADPGMATCAILTRIIDEQGHFLYVGLKPGKYLVSTCIRWTAQDSRRVETGRTTTYNGFGQVLWSQPTYARENYTFADVRTVVGAVEFTGEGQTQDLLVTD